MNHQRQPLLQLPYVLPLPACRTARLAVSHHSHLGLGELVTDFIQLLRSTVVKRIPRKLLRLIIQRVFGVAGQNECIQTELRGD